MCKQDRFPRLVHGALLSLLLIATGCRGKVEEVVASDPAVVEQAAGLEVAAGDWPWWRGPSRSGIADGPAPPTVWSDGQHVLWQTEVPGRGHASPIVAGEAVYLATADEAKETMSLVACQRETGELLWQARLHEGPFMHTHGKNSQASATPACDGEQIYCVCMIKGGVWVTAVDTLGKIVWQQQAGPFTSRHGYGSSPTLYKSLVIVSGDSTAGGYLAALNRADGKLVWRKPRPSDSSFGTPVIAEVAGKTQLLMSGQDAITSYDPSNGETLWTCQGPAQTTANTIAWSGDRIVASGGYPENNVICLRADGAGDVTATHIQWQHEIKAYVPLPLILDGRVIVTQDSGIVTCYDLDTGDELWKQRMGGGFSASPVAVDDLVYLPNEAGEVFIFRAGDKYEEVARNRLTDGGFASPAIVQGRIYLRTDKHLYCIGESPAE